MMVIVMNTEQSDTNQTTQNPKPNGVDHREVQPNLKQTNSDNSNTSSSRSNSKTSQRRTTTSKTTRTRKTTAKRTTPQTEPNNTSKAEPKTTTAKNVPKTTTAKKTRPTKAGKKERQTSTAKNEPDTSHTKTQTETKAKTVVTEEPKTNSKQEALQRKMRAMGLFPPGTVTDSQQTKQQNIQKKWQELGVMARQGQASKKTANQAEKKSSSGFGWLFILVVGAGAYFGYQPLSQTDQYQTFYKEVGGTMATFIDNLPQFLPNEKPTDNKQSIAIMAPTVKEASQPAMTAIHNAEYDSHTMSHDNPSVKDSVNLVTTADKQVTATRNSHTSNRATDNTDNTQTIQSNTDSLDKADKTKVATTVTKKTIASKKRTTLRYYYYRPAVPTYRYPYHYQAYQPQTSQAQSYQTQTYQPYSYYYYPHQWTYKTK